MLFKDLVYEAENIGKALQESKQNGKWMQSTKIMVLIKEIDLGWFPKNRGVNGQLAGFLKNIEEF